MEEPSFKSICKSIGKYTPSGPVAYSEVQRKIFEFQNYQNFLSVVNADKERDYFLYPYPGRLYGRRKNNNDSYSDQQEALKPLLAYPINERTVDEFEKGLKYFIKTHVRGKGRLYDALKTGFSGSGIAELYKDCVIVTHNNDKFGTYDTQLVRGGIRDISPTINMYKLIKEVEAEVQRNINARYAGGSRRSKKNRNRKTRRLRR